MSIRNAKAMRCAESKMAREMLCFTVETAVVGHEGRICETAAEVEISRAKCDF